MGTVRAALECIIATTAPPLGRPQFQNETMKYLDETKSILIDVLSLGEAGARLDAQSPLLGSLPELDSMAVVSIIGALEDRFGIAIDDDDISASTFDTLGSLAAFVAQKRGE
jgi:acyl carrier protein